MKIRWCTFPAAVVVLFVVGSLAQGQSPRQADQRVELTAGSIQINLVLPVTLQPLSGRKVALAQQQGVPAKFIFNDTESDVILAINTFGRDAAASDLPKLVDQIKAAAAKHGVATESLTSDLVTLNGKQWLRLSFKEGSGAAELVNEYFVTDWLGEYVLFNFSLPAARYASYRSTFERSARSVQLGLSAQAADLHVDAVTDQQKKQ